MQFTLSPKWTAFVQKQVKAKKYRSATELLQTALLDLQQKQARQSAGAPSYNENDLEWQRREVAKGLADDESIVMTDELIEAVKARGRKRFAARQRSAQ